MVQLKDILRVAKSQGISKQKALNLLCQGEKEEACPSCKEKGLVPFYHSDGVCYNCIFCAYEIGD